MSIDARKVIFPFTSSRLLSAHLPVLLIIAYRATASYSSSMPALAYEEMSTNAFFSRWR
ncbi:hypothetical protein EV356DRAFT_496384 [Viridothelium virens]|uniref:Uncharacterized protein n=1 Tax=Viridothelium virens TaxID=1048519 RepID=A0A6A6GUB5_VIRVR|nr:hypothetical protein EV356DRAFT_496384 [Viridothelium virens]